MAATPLKVNIFFAVSDVEDLGGSVERFTDRFINWLEKVEGIDEEHTETVIIETNLDEVIEEQLSGPVETVTVVVEESDIDD